MSGEMPVLYGCAPVYETHFRDGGSEPKPPSEAVIEAVAAVEGIDPTALPPLYGTVEPDALDRLFDRPRAGASHVFCFDYHEWVVVVRGDGVVVVCDPDERIDPKPVFGER